MQQLMRVLLYWGIGSSYLLLAEEPGMYSPPVNDEETSVYTQMNATLDNFYPNSEMDQGLLVNWMDEALKFAHDYLEAMDRGQYAQTWIANDQVMQNIIGKGEWVGGLNKTRSQLGRVETRSLRSKRMAINPNGLPRGVYVVLEYDTSFENAINAEEMLVVHR